MKIIFIFILLVCSISTLYAQKTKIDSIHQQLKTIASDTNKVNLLNELAWLYTSSAPKKTREYAEQGMELAQKLGFSKGEVVALNYLGDHYWRQGQYARSVEYATLSLKAAIKAKDSLGIASAYRLLGITHSFSLNQYELALKYHRLALPIYERSKNKQKIIAQYGSVVWVFYMMNQEIDSADFYAKKALTLMKEIKNDQLMSWSLNSMGLVASRKGQLDSAIFYFRQSNEFATKVNDIAVIAYNKSLIGHIYLQQNRNEAAVKLFQQNIPDIKKIKLNGVLSRVYEGLAKGYASQKQYDSAYLYYQNYIHLRDSLINWETSQKIAIIEAEYTEERKQARINYLEKERMIVSSVVGTAFIALLVALFLILRNNRQRKNANQLLQAKNEEIAHQNEELAQSQEEITTQRDKVAEQNKELQELNETKNKLFVIIGHDLRSPINSLKGLLNLLTNRHISIDEFFMFSGKLKNGVEHVYFTLNNLLQWANSQMQGLKSNPQNINLYAIGQENFNLLTQTLADKKILFFNQIQEKLTALADQDQINLVFRNLISNAVKFSNEEGCITLSSQTFENFCEIAVSDTGIGMSAEDTAKLFNKTTHFTTSGTVGEKGTGLGLLLCQEMIEINNGKIWVESEIGKGTIFKFTLITQNN